MKNPFNRLILKIIIEHAMQREEDSFNIYTAAADRATDDASRKLMKELAGEELKHRLKLESIQHGKSWKKDQNEEIHLDDAQFEQFTETLPISIGPDAKYFLQSALEREQSMSAYYSGIADHLKPGEIRDIFIFLAGEEEKHVAEIEKRIGRIPE